MGNVVRDFYRVGLAVGKSWEVTIGRTVRFGE